MKKLIMLIIVFSSLFSYQICESYIGKSYYIVCLNGNEFIRFNNYHGGGLSKTGYKCKCVIDKGTFSDGYKVERY